MADTTSDSKWLTLTGLKTLVNKLKSYFVQKNTTEEYSNGNVSDLSLNVENQAQCLQHIYYIADEEKTYILKIGASCITMLDGTNEVCLTAEKLATLLTMNNLSLI